MLALACNNNFRRVADWLLMFKLACFRASFLAVFRILDSSSSVMFSQTDRFNKHLPEPCKEAHSSIVVSDVVQLVEFSPFDNCTELVAYVTSERICVGVCHSQVENVGAQGIEFTSLRDFHHSCRVTAFAWSPETNLISVPKVVRFVVGESDRKVRLYTSDLQENHQVQELGEHQSYVNDVGVEPDTGTLVASAGDDNACRIWNLSSDAVACFRLGSPGMSVCWHKLEPNKLMVAEKKGVIRFYNVANQTPITSVDCARMPLMSADWCLADPRRLVALAGYEYFIFDTSQSSGPVERKQAHSNCGTRIQWCRSNGHLLASMGTPATQIKVFNVKSNQVSLSAKELIANGLSWHKTQPILAVGGDRKIHFWNVDIV